ncbi:MAG: cyclic pyranopterin monophosphate synthase MoaC [Acidimicrobiales bacterium]
MTADGGLGHVDERGRASMVNVVAKPPTYRVARASCAVTTTLAGRELLRDPATGADIVSTARTAGLEGAKRTAVLIPLCHPIRIDAVRVDVTIGQTGVAITASAESVERTGLEMEALTACACAALSIVRAVLSVDPGVRVDDLVLLHKSGGRSGTWNRSPDDPVVGQDGAPAGRDRTARRG